MEWALDRWSKYSDEKYGVGLYKFIEDTTGKLKRMPNTKGRCNRSNTFAVLVSVDKEIGVVPKPIKVEPQEVVLFIKEAFWIYFKIKKKTFNKPVGCNY